MAAGRAMGTWAAVSKENPRFIYSEASTDSCR
jgi:hypothetical protein